jgi:hypothetical protein
MSFKVRKHRPCQLNCLTSSDVPAETTLDLVPAGATEYSMVLFVDQTTQRVILQIPNQLGWKYHYGCPVKDTLTNVERIVDKQLQLVPSGLLLFHFTNHHSSPIRVLIYTCLLDFALNDLGGCWYSFLDIPYKNMWADDRYWMPNVLAGRYVEGHFLFDGPPGTETPLLQHAVQVYDETILEG